MNKYNQSSDIVLPAQHQDSISSLSVNGTELTPSTILISGCWDNTVTCYELQSNANGQLVSTIMQGQIKHEAPVLCTDIHSDGYTAFSAGCDGQVRAWDVRHGPIPSAVQVVGKHDQPVRVMKFNPELNCLVTGSWDKTVKLWDLRSPAPAQSYNFPERVYAMDAKGDALVVGTADKMINIYNIRSGNTACGSYKSPLSYQLRNIKLFANLEGYAVSCIEGRVALDYFHEMDTLAKIRNNNAQKPANIKSFVFKCHRHDADIYAVSVLDFYKNNALLTAGSDGTFCFWDIQNKSRLGAYELHKGKSPITCGKFTPSGNMLFYALSYDWSKGAAGLDKTFPNSIHMHPIDPVGEMVKRTK